MVVVWSRYDDIWVICRVSILVHTCFFFTCIHLDIMMALSARIAICIPMGIVVILSACIAICIFLLWTIWLAEIVALVILSCIERYGELCSSELAMDIRGGWWYVVSRGARVMVLLWLLWAVLLYFCIFKYLLYTVVYTAFGALREPVRSWLFPAGSSSWLWKHL